MRHRLLYIAPVLLILFTLGINLFQLPTAFADDTQTQEATKFCNLVASATATTTTGPNSLGTETSNSTPANPQGNTACQKGFLAGLSKDASKPPISSAAQGRCVSASANDVDIATCQVYLTKQGECYSSIYKSDSANAYYCQIGYLLGYNNRSSLARLPVDQTPAQKQASAQQAALQTQAEQACQPTIPGGSNASQLLMDCEAGYIGATNSQSQTQACASNSGTSIDQQYCDNGYAAQQASSASASGSTSLGCTAQFTDPLTWILCPMVGILSQVVNFVDGLITNQMDVKTDAIFCTTCKNANTCNAYYTAWQSFRDIALGLMTIAALVLIMSQALGLEILDAYTIRKTLPRLLIAAVAITLSWPLMRFLIQFSDDLGFGVRSIIYAPFSKLGNSIDLSFGGGIGNLFGAVAGVGGAVAAVPIWIIAGGPAALLAYVGTAALAVVVAILVLILRQIAIIMLMLLAPLALVAYILPNTQRIYRMWWESFSKALLMFPLIAAFIATGRVFSAVAIHNGGVINQLIGFAAYFAPYFMIPLTFRMAGGAVGAMGNFVQGRAAGGFSALANKRKETRQERTKFAQKNGIYRPDLMNKNPFTGKQFKNGRSLGNLLNTVGNYTVDIGDSGSQKLGGTKLGAPFLGRRKRTLEGKIAHDRLEQSQKMAGELDPHYWTGRAMGGRLNHFLDSISTDEANPQRQALAAQFKQHYGINDEHGDFTGKYRDLNGEKDAWQMSHLLRDYGGGTQGAMIAAEELSEGAHVSTAIGRLRGNEETQRVDIGTVGLIAAARAGRLDETDKHHDLTETRNDLAASGKDFGGFADARLSLLQKVGEGKRIEQSRGHMEIYEEDGHGHLRVSSVYADPVSDLARKSWRRIDAGGLGRGKSEAVAALRETMVADASMSKVKNENGRVVLDLDANGNRQPKVGEELEFAKQAQNRIKYMASYAQGDSGVGVELQRVANDLGMGDLSFGAGGRLPNDLVGGGGDPSAPDPAAGAPI